jgi:hypothetical protein
MLNRRRPLDELLTQWGIGCFVIAPEYFGALPANIFDGKSGGKNFRGVQRPKFTVKTISGGAKVYKYAHFRNWHRRASGILDFISPACSTPCSVPSLPCGNADHTFSHGRQLPEDVAHCHQVRTRIYGRKVDIRARGSAYRTGRVQFSFPPRVAIEPPKHSHWHRAAVRS